MHYEYSRWEKDVATRGWFTGVYGSVGLGHTWSNIIDAPGTNSK